MKRKPSKRPMRMRFPREVLVGIGLVVALLCALGITLYVHNHRHTNVPREIAAAALRYCQTDWAMHEPETPHDQWMQTNNRVEDMDINGDTASWIVDCQDKRFQLDSNAARIIFQKNDDGTWSAVTSAFLW